jgi:peptidoglycan-associated lipoprotein
LDRIDRGGTRRLLDYALDRSAGRRQKCRGHSRCWRRANGRRGGWRRHRLGNGLRRATRRDPNNILSKRSVYFDYDSFVVMDEYRSLVEAHARYLQQNRSARTTVQGNTDERGSREYNIALAQKRADSVKRMMTLLGANESQIETVSFGKEKPKNPGHDETAWAENRRDDIVYPGE